MAPPLLLDISTLDLSAVVADAAEIERVNPHRGVMRLLDGIIWHDIQGGAAVAFKDVRSDEFWVPGHIPGRPLLPGVLMIEAGAQLASYMAIKLSGHAFIGFIGCDAVKFRSQVVPGDRLLILGKGVQFKARRIICDVQGLVKGNLVFEARITGMPI